MKTNNKKPSGRSSGQPSMKVIRKVLERAVDIQRRCPDVCRDFTIMTSVMRKQTILLRWTTINIADIDKPVQCYHYECFNPDGSPQNCSVNYSNQEEANAFFESLQAHHYQQFPGTGPGTGKAGPRNITRVNLSDKPIARTKHLTPKTNKKCIKPVS